jgi:hypothetical protein
MVHGGRVKNRDFVLGITFSPWSVVPHPVVRLFLTHPSKKNEKKEKKEKKRK